MIKKIFLSIIFINYIISTVYENSELEKLELNKLYNESNNLKIRMLKEIKSKPSTSKKKKSLKKQKKSKKKRKKRKKRKLKKKETEIYYLKKLISAITPKKSLKKEKKKKRNLKKNPVGKNGVNNIDKIMAKSQKIPQEDRKLFAGAVLDFGLEGITNLFHYLETRASTILSNPDEILKPISYIYFIIGLYQYFQNHNLQTLKLNIMKVRISSIIAQTGVVEEMDHDVQQALYGIKGLERKASRISSDAGFRLDRKIEMFNDIS